MKEVIPSFFLRHARWIRWFKPLCKQGRAINRKYEAFFTKFSNIRLNTDISNVSWFFIRNSFWSRWFKPSFVERTAHRTVQLKRNCKAVFFTKLKNIEANNDICNVSWVIVRRSLWRRLCKVFLTEHPVNKTMQ